MYLGLAFATSQAADDADKPDPETFDEGEWPMTESSPRTTPGLPSTRTYIARLQSHRRYEF